MIYSCGNLGLIAYIYCSMHTRAHAHAIHSNNNDDAKGIKEMIGNYSFFQ